MAQKSSVSVLPTLGHQNQLQSLMKTFNHPPPLPKKIQQKKEFILLKLPLFMTIYQKKGDQNFTQIVNYIKLTQFSFGQVILSSECLSDDKDIDEEGQKFQRTFNYVLKGSVMLFTVKENQRHSRPEFYKKLGPNQYFGQKLSFGHDKLYQVKAISPCYILQLDINIFYNTFAGHFQYAQLKDKITFLQQIWIFSEMRRSTIQKILLLSENVKYIKNTVLFQKGTIPEKIYVIVSGELTLFQRQENQKVKFVPFCLLSRSQICGVEEIALQKEYEYSGVVTSQFLEVMIISKELYEEHLQYYTDLKGDYMKKIYSEKQKLKNMGIKYDKEYKEVVEYNKKRQADLFRIFAKNFKKIIKNPAIEMQKVQLTHVQQLKDPGMREMKLRQIKEKQNRQFNSSSLSTLTNNSYTKDKNILINYLTKKERVRRKTHENEFKYQRSLSSQSGVVKSIHVESSSAVKNHKRKLLKSRYKSVSLLSK